DLLRDRARPFDYRWLSVGAYSVASSPAGRVGCDPASRTKSVTAARRLLGGRLAVQGAVDLQATDVEEHGKACRVRPLEFPISEPNLTAACSTLVVSPSRESDVHPQGH